MTGAPNEHGMMLDPRTVRIVITLAEELHFGRTAAKLHMSQPALSEAVKTLERGLGVQLFTRSSRNVDLTEAGRIFSEEGRALVMQAERIVSLVRASVRASAGPLRVGYPPLINVNWLCSMAAKAGRGFELPPRFVGMDSVAIADLLLKGELDAALVAGPLPNPEIESKTLFREALTAAIPAGHRLAKQSSIALGDLAAEPVILLRADVSPSLRGDFLDLCSAHGYKPRVSHEAATFYECIQFVRHSLGISFIPAAAQNEMRDRKVAFAELQDAFCVRWALAYRRNSSAKRLDLFEQFVFSNLPESK